MATATGRKTVSIYDYPEHLNPFHEEDHHNRIRFWTLGRKLNRSNSINFSGIKTDLKNSWAFRSFMRKGKKNSTLKPDSKPQTNGVNGDHSPIVFRRALQYSSVNYGTVSGSRTTIGSPERPDRYVYGGSVTPLPRSRFQERLRSPSQQEVNSLRGTSMTPRLARSDVMGSQLSVQSTNPFDEDGAPVPPARASRRKKNKAPLPPARARAADVTVSSAGSEDLNKSAAEPEAELDAETIPLNIELRIVEDDEAAAKSNEDAQNGNTEQTNTDAETKTEETVVVHKTQESKPDLITEINVDSSQTPDKAPPAETETKETIDAPDKASSEEDLPAVPFPKIDIVTYRRNSSLNEDDFRLRRPHEDSANKRSKSLTGGLNNSFVTYDINLNEDVDYSEPKKVVCKLYDAPRKPSLDTSISSTEREFIEIDRATRELEREISKLNSALSEDDADVVLGGGGGGRLSVSDIKKRFDNNNFISSPNPIPKPRRSHYGSSSPINGNY